MAMAGRFAGVIFDVDGTLVDSNGFHAKAWARAFQENGFAVTAQDVRPLIGMGGDKIIPKVTGFSDDTTLGAAVSKRHKEIFKKEYMPALRKFTKTRKLLLKLKSMGIKIAIASSADQDEIKPLLEIAQVDDLVAMPPEARGESDDSKPAPDTICTALEQLKISPDQAVMIGDTPYDVEAASQAGIATIALRTGGWDDRALKRAIAIYDDPEDLWLRVNSSPLGMAGALQSFS
jgi:HAD superfamily hydrolase (TIGR01509 family)